ncbi:MAG: DUF2878 domain-containing protein [Desulfobacterales bacterium]|nr:DUF2878 domain-containing protein [Desulfobacterales bacterium]
MILVKPGSRLGDILPQARAMIISAQGSGLRKIINAVTFQASWFAAVLGAAHGVPCARRGRRPGRSCLTPCAFSGLAT